MEKRSNQNCANRTNAHPNARAANDAWVDQTADRVASLLSEEGLSMEMVVFYDPLTETIHAIGYDGAPSRYFGNLETRVPTPALPAGPKMAALPGGTPPSPPAAISEVPP